MHQSQKKEWVQFYSELYERLNEITPLQIDCGELCGSHCCSDEAGEGIFLFPGEEVMFENKPYWGDLIKIDGMDAVQCDGDCPRDERPLACRLFPLFPYLSKDGELEIRFYSPMTLYCPLIKLCDYTMLAPDYLEEVQEIASILADDPACFEFIKKISRDTDKYESEPWANLLK